MIRFCVGAKNLVRQPVQEGLDRRVGELAIGIPDTGEASRRLPFTSG
jgi:hypothetical protein